MTFKNKWGYKLVEMSTISGKKSMTPIEFIKDGSIYNEAFLADSVYKLSVDLSWEKEFDKNFYLFQNIRHLELLNCNIDFVNIDFSKFKHLKHLTITIRSGTKLFINEAISDSLSELGISGCRTLREIEKGDNDFLNIQSLYLSNIPPETLNKFNFSELIQLKYLQISNCELTSLPQSLFQNQSITHLDLHGNLLETIQPEIQNMKSLKFLILSENKFAKKPKLPDRIWIVID